MEVNRRHGAALTLVGAAPLAVWFLLGQLREGSGIDYIFRVPNLPRPVELAVGVALFSIVVVVGTNLWQNGRRWLIEGGWCRVYARLLAAGLLVAVGVRLVTAASSGANIGGGMILMLGPLPLLYMTLRAVHISSVLRSPDVPRGRSPGAIEFMASGGSGFVLTTFGILCGGFLAVMLIPTPALVAVGAVAGVTPLVRA